MSVSRAYLEKAYLAYFGRPIDPNGVAWYTQPSMTEAQVEAEFSSSAESQALYGQGFTIAQINAIYNVLFGRDGDVPGMTWWANQVAQGLVTPAAAAISILNGAQGTDKVAVENKLAASHAFTAGIDTAPEIVGYSGADANAVAVAFLAGITATPATPAEVDAAIAASVAAGSGNGGATDFMLTDGVDNLFGNDQDNVFSAPVVQNQNGDLVNSFETGDSVNGGAGTDTLNITLIDSQSTNFVGAPAISATTSDVEIVNVRAQYINVDAAVNWSNIDAELMAGVQQYWDDNSRADVQIEDVRQLPEELTFGMRQTDPGVSYSVYFDPAQLSADRGTAGDSSLTLTMVNNTDPASELAGFAISGVGFTLGGVEYRVESPAFDAAQTYAEFADALSAALAEIPALAGLTVTLNPNGSITMTDPAGATFGTLGFSWVDNLVPAEGNLSWNQAVGAAVISEAPITTDVVLDAVGRTAQGGTLDIGSMAEGGVEVFNVSVDRSSWLSEMASTSFMGDHDFHQLETVNLYSIGANGDLAVGDVGSVYGEDYNYNYGYWYGDFLDGRVEDGLWDVREVNNVDFVGDLNLGITLTEDSISRYLDPANAEVMFSYTGGAGNDNFTIWADEALSGDGDFAMTVNLGAGDDRLNLDVPVVTKVMVDGGTGVNTIAVAESHGTDVYNTFKGFANFQNYEVEGNNATKHDFTSMAGVTNVKVMTWDGANTALIDLPVADVTISGQNQTLAYRSNYDQEFGIIDILGADTATLDVKLENTARLDANLNVFDLNIGDESAANKSAVRTLNLDSDGDRNTTNSVDVIHAAMVNTFNLTGTQDLTVGMLASAANSTAASAQVQSLVVDASTLTGDLDLTVYSGLISNVDAGATSKVTLTGTAGAADSLTIDGSFFETAINTTADTTISGFETVAFNDTWGVFDATHVSGVTLFDIVNTDGDFAMTNMSGIDTVQINAAESWSIDGGLTFAAAARETSNVLTLEFRDASGNYNGTDFTPGWDALQVQDYRELTLDLGGNATQNDDYYFDLTFLDADGDDEWFGYDPETVYARTLTVVGGGDQGVTGSADGTDSVDLGNVTNVLSMIDTTGYTGFVTLQLDMFDSAILDRNTTIEVNGYGLDATETQAGTDGNIVSYVFTTDAVKATEDWDITGFNGFQMAGVDLTNLSILDLSALGVNGLVDLNIVDDGVNTTITSNEGLNFEIFLVGVVKTDLSNENFVFA
jgi:hypothetical protein